MKYEIDTRIIDTVSMSVEMAIILGLMPCLTAPKIAVGKVSTPAPLTKLVMMKSSREIIKANRKPDRMPGTINGNKISKKVCPGVA